MSDRVIPFSGPFFGKINADQVLEAAYEKLSEVVVIGWADTELYVAASSPHPGDILLLLEKAKAMVLDSGR